MSNESLRELLDLLQHVTGACADLGQRVSTAEEIFQNNSPELYQEYKKKLDARKSGVQQTGIALTFERLRKNLLQG